MRGRSQVPELTTYQKARLQVVGYRTIQNSVNKVLSAHELNTSQWIILGWLQDNPAGMRVTALASVLDVETPLITTLISPLLRRGLIISESDQTDKRAKQLRLTEEGLVLVMQLEPELTERLKFYEVGFKKGELEAYFEALEQFIRNAKTKGE